MNEEYESAIDEVVERFVTSGDFWSREIVVPKEHRNMWLRMRKNPKHFTSAMFIGTWSDNSKVLSESPLRLVRAMDMPDDSIRIIGRQGDDLFVLILEGRLA
jgi:hypothetical protein